MRQGHILDANTVLLYRMDDNTVDLRSLSPFTDPSGRVWTFPLGVCQPVAYSPIPGEFCRRFLRSGAGVMFSPMIGSDLVTTRGTWTMEFFMKLNDDSFQGLPGLVGPSGDPNAASNIITRPGISAGHLDQFWESGVGVNQAITATADPAQLFNSAAGWMHVAIVKDSTAKTVKTYRNGSLVATNSYTTDPTGGEDCQWAIGIDNTSLVGSNRGAYDIRHWTMSSVARDATWLANNAVLMNTTGVLATDANTYLDVLFNGSPVVAVNDGTMGSSMDLISKGTTDTRICEPTSLGGLVADGGRGINSYECPLAARDGYNSTFRDILVDSWTFEAWMMIASLGRDFDSTQAMGIFSHGVGLDEQQVNNYCALMCTVSRQFWFEMESGTGSISNGVVATAADVFPIGRPVHVAVRKTMTGATWTGALFLDGAKVAEETGLTNYDGGTTSSGSSACFFTLGKGANDTLSFGHMIFDDVRFSDIARTDEEIGGSYWRGIGTAVAVDVVSPPSGTTVAPLDSIVFDVTSDAGIAVASVSVTLFYVDGSSVAVWDGNTFATEFEASSSSPTTGGHRFTLVAGWSQTVARIEVSATDYAGTSDSTAIGSWLVEGALNSAAPTITVLSPTPGIAPGQPGGFPSNPRLAAVTPVVVRISDLDPGVQYICLVIVVNGVEEVVYRRGQFRGAYAAGSTQVVSATEVTLTIVRAGGWPSAAQLTFRVDAVDAAGNLAS